MKLFVKAISSHQQKTNFCVFEFIITNSSTNQLYSLEPTRAYYVMNNNIPTITY